MSVRFPLKWTAGGHWPGRLILHLGLPKTATTTLQSLFSQMSCGYLGPGSTSLPRGFFPELTRVFREEAPEWWESTKSLQLRSLFTSAIRATGTYSNQAALLFSWEAALTGGLFIRPPRDSEDYSQIKHLKYLWKEVASAADEVTIVLTVRRQDSWLASLYAQKSVRIEGASQLDFENQIDEILSCSEMPIPLDLEATASGLLSAFPGASVVLLPIESISSPGYRNILNHILGLELFTPGWAKEVKNARRIETSRWQLRKLRPELQDSHSYRIARLATSDTTKRSLDLGQRLGDRVMTRVSSSNEAVLSFAPIGLPQYVSKGC